MIMPNKKIETKRAPTFFYMEKVLQQREHNVTVYRRNGEKSILTPCIPLSECGCDAIVRVQNQCIFTDQRMKRERGREREIVEKRKNSIILKIFYNISIHRQKTKRLNSIKYKIYIWKICANEMKKKRQL